MQDKIRECYKVKNWIKNTAFKLRNIDQIRDVLRKQSHTKRADVFKAIAPLSKIKQKKAKQLKIELKTLFLSCII